MYLVFHSFNGCDTTSSFFGKGKKSFYDTWKNFPEIMPEFTKLSSISNPTQISEADVQDLEQFVVSLYSRTVNANKIYTARRTLFAQGNRTVENIPPTSDALKEHIKRSALQAIVWRQCSRKLLPAIDLLQRDWQKQS